MLFAFLLVWSLTYYNFIKLSLPHGAQKKIINFYTLRLMEPKEKIFYTLASYGVKKKNLYLAYDSENRLTNN